MPAFYHTRMSIFSFENAIECLLKMPDFSLEIMHIHNITSFEGSSYEQ